LFLELKAYSLIYCNLLLKAIDFIIKRSQNPTKKDYFAGAGLISPTINFVNSGEGLKTW
jgi:hypothetical protein